MHNKLITAITAIFVLNIAPAKAQLYTGSTGMTIKSGTIFATEGLVLLPSADLTLDNLKVAKSATPVSAMGGNSVSRVYYFSRAITFSGSAGFYYQDDELNGNTAAALAIFYKNQFGDNTYVSPAGSSSDVPNKYVSQTFNYVDFSDITAADQVVTLPVNLISFAATAENNRSKITWKTASEQNSHHYLVERAGDDRVFYPFAVVDAKGTTNQLSNYLLYDNAPLNGNNYYRLTQFDTNGASYPFGVKQVSFKLSTATSLTAFPNPVTGNTINVKLDNYDGKEVVLYLVDLLGRTLYQQKFSHTTGVNIHTLQLNTKPAAGQYILYVKGTGLNEKVKLLVL